MGCIYKVTNLINGKQYVGQTVKTAELRFKEHITRANYGDDKHTAFHNAIRKYGVENFKLETIEGNLDEEMLNEREIYWIAYYDTFNNGYNLTVGGDGKRTYSVKELEKAYIKYGSAKKAAEAIGCNKSTVVLAAKTTNHEIYAPEKVANKVYAINSKDKSEIIEFHSSYEAANFLNERENTLDKKKWNEQRAVNVRQVADKGNTRQSYLGFIWSYSNKFEEKIELGTIEKSVVESLEIRQAA